MAADRSLELWLDHARTSHMPDDRTCRWPRPVIHIDPGIEGGRPMVAGAPVVSVAARILAGEPLEDVADDYGINRRQALVACWWSGTHDDDYTDWWARWADQVHAALAAADDTDTVCAHIPDPPAMTDEPDEPAYRRTEDVPVKKGLL